MLNIRVVLANGDQKFSKSLSQGHESFNANFKIDFLQGLKNHSHETLYLE